MNKLKTTLQNNIIGYFGLMQRICLKDDPNLLSIYLWVVDVLLRTKLNVSRCSRLGERDYCPLAGVEGSAGGHAAHVSGDRGYCPPGGGGGVPGSAGGHAARPAMQGLLPDSLRLTS